MKFKRLVSGVLATVLSFGIATGVAVAAGSATGGVTVVEDSSSTDQYVISDVDAVESWTTIRSDTPSVATAIKAFNDAVVAGDTDAALAQLEALADDESLPESVRTSVAEVLQTIKDDGLEALTPFFDLDRTGEGVKKTADGDYEVTLDIPSITSATTDVTVLHYNIEDQQFELIKASSVDTANKQATFVFENLSPVMILAKAGTTATATTTTSTSSSVPVTGDTSANWGAYAAAGVVVLAAGIAVFALRRKSANQA